jgi:multidrug transporter EmrE-like cation transporter
MPRMTPMTLLFVGIFIFGQLLGIYLLPRTVGLTRLLPTVACAACFVIAIGALARLSFKGVPLGILIPMSAAVVPLATIFMGMVLYGESASPLKLTLLIGACGAVGWAAALG